MGWRCRENQQFYQQTHGFSADFPIIQSSYFGNGSFRGIVMLSNQ
jgi:hypothetical protein